MPSVENVVQKKNADEDKVMLYVTKKAALEIKVLAGLMGLERKESEIRARIKWSDEKTRRGKIDAAIKWVQEFNIKEGRAPTQKEFCRGMENGSAIVAAIQHGIDSNIGGGYGDLLEAAGLKRKVGPSKNSITEEEEKEIRKMAGEGKHVGEVAKRIGRTNMTIRSYLDRNSVQYRKIKFRYITEDEGREIKRMAGSGVAEIAQKIGRSSASIRSYLKRNEITYSEKIKHITDDEGREIKRMAEEGKTAVEIAKEIGRNYVSIWEYLAKKNIPYEKKNFKYVTDDEGREIKRMAEEGKTAVEIAKEIGRTSVTIRSYLKRNDVPFKKELSRITDHERREIKRMAEEGKTAVEIAKEIGRNYVSIRAYLRTNGVAYKKRHMKPITNDESVQIIDMAKAGKPPYAIGEELGRHPAVIRSHLKRNMLKEVTSIRLRGD
ncbi:MAG: helix-turn-helix domain-containing protein [Candidatus Micrarchaeota archaeon]|nr:helix-turn-helix domain-containing protein [Candidatus Micrarchaeota archaeon]